MSNFVHLHVHTEYSLLDGLSKINKLIARVKELDMPAVAITDHGVMYGAIDFYKQAKKEGINPIIGMEGYVTPGDHTKKEGKEDKVNNHIVLLAKNYTGYQNLMKLTTIGHLEGFYYRPRVSKEVLRQHSEGLIALSACPKGEIGQQLIEDDYAGAKKLAQWYAEIFGEGNFFLEIQRHQYKDYLDKITDVKLKEKLQKMQTSEDKWVAGIIKLSRDLGLPLVATNDSHYIKQTDATAQDALVCISTGKNVSDIDRLRYVDTPTLHLKSEAEMLAIFPEFPEALENTKIIADQVNLEMDLGKSIYPKMELPKGETAPDALKRIAHEKVSERYETLTDEISKRLDYELEVICNKGYAPYFLILADLANWCTSVGIIINTRGSAAGSVASYVMGITTVDPLKYSLPFERFLNPYRPSAPDIDLDIADDRREQLISYIIEKYGKDKVAQICTFGKMLARAAVRDISRVLGYPYAVGDKISKMIPLGSQGFPMTIEKAIEITPELAADYKANPDTKKIIDLGREIEGNARHISVHAAGVVISPGVMTDFTPLQLEPDGEKIITQYDMHSIADEYGGVGLVKIDVLGIRNLSILGAARDIVEQTAGVKINLSEIPLDDKKTYDMLSRGETMGTFQLGGSGMTKWLMELKPNRIEDIMVMIALFRPGPMANIPEYIARKNKKSEVTYFHPKMAEFLDKSYGILVYQEDIMFTGMAMAGYTWETIDKLRKAIGKKLPKEMAEQHEVFIEGCINTSGLTKVEAEKLWDLFVPFQGYGFNKAHAASYGIVAYQTAYLKAHYPVEYMCALLTAESGDTEKIAEAVEECKRMKIKVLAPDINKSGVGFTIEDNTIRFGLSAIKNVGEAAIRAILKARESVAFNTMSDFATRVDLSKVNKKVLESLIKAGALDDFGKRSSMLAGVEKLIAESHKKAKSLSTGQSGLFEDSLDQPKSFTLPNLDELPKEQLLTFEYEFLGFYLTEHPAAKFLQQVNETATHNIASILEDVESFNGKTVTVGGLITGMRKIFTKKNNDEMAFVTIESSTGIKMECVVFPRTFTDFKDYWQINNVVLINGKIDSREDRISLIVEKARKIN